MRVRWPGPSAFTLIELLVVVAIISVLLGMLAPMLGMARRHASQANTGALLRKVDTALRLFKADVRVYPWDGCLQPRLLHDGSSNPDFSRNYPALGAGGPDWANRLMRHVGRSLEASAAADVIADVEAAARAFDYDRTNADGTLASEHEEVAGRYGVHTFLQSDAVPYGFAYESGAWKAKTNDAVSLAMMLNRMAQERYGLAMMAGATAIHGPAVQEATSPTGAVYASANPNASVRATTPVVGTPASAADPGWGDDYLHGELRAADVRGDAIVDAWGSPLIYVCQVLPGCQPASDARPFNGTSLGYVDPDMYGLGPHGRIPLAAYDGVRQRELAVDPIHLPDPSDRMRSDIRRYAAVPYAQEFELWSAGPRRDAAWMRNDPMNSDNIAARPYLAELR